MEGGPYQEYFAIEIPIITTSNSSMDNITEGPSHTTDSVSSIKTIDDKDSESSILRSNKSMTGNISWRCTGHRRFVFVKEEHSASFPMQFGLEVSSSDGRYMGG